MTPEEFISTLELEKRIHEQWLVTVPMTRDELYKGIKAKVERQKERALKFRNKYTFTTEGVPDWHGDPVPPSPVSLTSNVVRMSDYWDHMYGVVTSESCGVPLAAPLEPPKKPGPIAEDFSSINARLKQIDKARSENVQGIPLPEPGALKPQKPWWS